MKVTAIVRIVLQAVLKFQDDGGKLDADLVERICDAVSQTMALTGRQPDL